MSICDMLKMLHNQNKYLNPDLAYTKSLNYKNFHDNIKPENVKNQKHSNRQNDSNQNSQHANLNKFENNLFKNKNLSILQKIQGNKNKKLDNIENINDYNFKMKSEPVN